MYCVSVHHNFSDGVQQHKHTYEVFHSIQKGKKLLGYRHIYIKKAARRDNIRSVCVCESVQKMKVVVTKMIRTLVILTTGATS